MVKRINPDLATLNCLLDECDTNLTPTTLAGAAALGRRISGERVPQ
jgi:hypothetical protein